MFMTRGQSTGQSGKSVYVGVDPASRADYFACVVDEPAGLGREMVHDVRHAERHRGLPYPGMAEKLRILIERLACRVTLAVDSTGIGNVVCDYLRDSKLGARLVPITFTSGSEERFEAGAYWIPKRSLIGGLGMVIETDRVRIAKTMKNADTLARELEGYEQTLTASGNETYGAPSGRHDDLVSALALAVWLAQKEAASGGRFMFAPVGSDSGGGFWSRF